MIKQARRFLFAKNSGACFNLFLIFIKHPLCFFVKDRVFGRKLKINKGENKIISRPTIAMARLSARLSG